MKKAIIWNKDSDNNIIETVYIFGRDFSAAVYRRGAFVQVLNPVQGERVENSVGDSDTFEDFESLAEHVREVTESKPNAHVYFANGENYVCSDMVDLCKQILSTSNHDSDVHDVCRYFKIDDEFKTWMHSVDLTVYGDIIIKVLSTLLCNIIKDRVGIGYLTSVTGLPVTTDEWTDCVEVATKIVLGHVWKSLHGTPQDDYDNWMKYVTDGMLGTLTIDDLLKN